MCSVKFRGFRCKILSFKSLDLSICNGHFSCRINFDDLSNINCLLYEVVEEQRESKGEIFLSLQYDCLLFF